MKIKSKRKEDIEMGNAEQQRDYTIETEEEVQNNDD